MTRSLTSLFVALAMLVALAVVPAVHAQGVPGFDANKCLAKKNKCVSKKIKGLMKCREKCQQKPDKCGAVQDACDQKVMDKFDGGANPAKGCFEKLEAKADPMKPESVCTTTGDTATMELLADASVGNMLAILEGGTYELCGNGIAEGNESCDDLDLAGATCVSLGFASGTLGCTAGCGYDVSACMGNPPPSACGNGVIDAGEDCDFEPGGLGGETCITQGQILGGLLQCGADCQFDYSGCAGANYVFVTSTTYDGDLGGVAGADAKCQARAVAAGLPGTYKAWISDSTSSPSTTFTQSPSAYVLVDLTQVAASWAALTGQGTVCTNCLDAPIDRDEFGVAVGAGTVWTGTRPDGTETGAGGALDYCGDWTSNDNSREAYPGDLSEVDRDWTFNVSGGDERICDRDRRLYCFQQ